MLLRLIIRPESELALVHVSSPIKISYDLVQNDARITNYIISFCVSSNDFAMKCVKSIMYNFD